MPSSLVRTLPIYILSSVLLLGAFSRFTHGKYTPRWYSFQEYHAPDDGSAVAMITPICDAILGSMLLFGSRAAKLSAAAIALLFFVIGLAMQMQAGKDFKGDVALVTIAAAPAAVLLRK